MAPGKFALAAMVVVLTGCGPPRDGRMISVPPPGGWEDRIVAYRADKDRRFLQDPETPLLPEDLESFEGLDYWPLDPEYRLVGPVHVHETRDRFEIPTTSGKVRPCEKYGWLSFELEGRLHTLQVYRLLDAPEGRPKKLFLPFADGTTGKETYPAGRYLDLEGEEGGVYALDFNQAYNPLCAYGSPERYACPRTPKENRLSVRIEAGERGYAPSR